MAILSVIWTVGLLIIVTTSLLWNGATSYGLSHTGFDLAVADAAAEAGIHRGILALLEGGRGAPWRADGTARRLEFNGETVEISIQDELGRIDLNRADETLLRSLLHSVGLDDQNAAGLADKIADWRESSSHRRLNGAKPEDYRAAGLVYRPRGAPFQSVDELLLVMGMTRPLFARIRPALTVYSGRPFVDPRVAPREALLALPGMNEDKADAMIASRGATPTLTSIDAASSLPGRAFAIGATVIRTTLRRHHESIVRLTGDAGRPYWVLSWRSR